MAREADDKLERLAGQVPGRRRSRSSEGLGITLFGYVGVGDIVCRLIWAMCADDEERTRSVRPVGHRVPVAHTCWPACRVARKKCVMTVVFCDCELTADYEEKLINVLVPVANRSLCTREQDLDGCAELSEGAGV